MDSQQKLKRQRVPRHIGNPFSAFPDLSKVVFWIFLIIDFEWTRKALREHVIEPADAFQRIENGRPKNESGEKNNDIRNRSGNKNCSSANLHSTITSNRNVKYAPLCSYGPQKEKGLLYYLRFCRDCPDEDPQLPFQQLVAEKANMVPLNRLELIPLRVISMRQIGQITEWNQNWTSE